MTKATDLESSSKVVIGELTSIRVGLIIFMVGAIVSSVWWAATTTAKLDSIITNQAATVSSISELHAEYNEMKLKQVVDENDIKELKNEHLIVPVK